MKKLFFLIAIVYTLGSFGQKTYLHCGNLMDVQTGNVLSQKTIVISENKIIEIQNGYVSGAAEDKIIDLKDKYVLPGFIDMHVHIESESSPKTYINKFTLNDADVAFQSSVYSGTV